MKATFCFFGQIVLQAETPVETVEGHSAKTAEEKADPLFEASKAPFTLPAAFLMLEKTKQFSNPGCISALTEKAEDEM